MHAMCCTLSMHNMHKYNIYATLQHTIFAIQKYAERGVHIERLVPSTCTANASNAQLLQICMRYALLHIQCTLCQDLDILKYYNFTSDIAIAILHAGRDRQSST